MLKAEKNAPGRIIPAKVLVRPRSLISTKFGRNVRIPGTISADSSTEKIRLRPRHRSRAKA